MIILGELWSKTTVNRTVYDNKRIHLMDPFDCDYGVPTNYF